MGKEKFSLDKVKEIAKDISENTNLSFEELPQYDLYLSQVTDFLKDKFEGEKFTNNIIQNYIKSEVILKPEDGKKRGYTKEHLAQLVLLSYMRPILTTEEIKKVFSLAFNEINDKNDDLISWEKAYKIFSKLQAESFTNFIGSDGLDLDKLSSIISDNTFNKADEEKMLLFLVVMSLISQATAMKKLVQKIVKVYGE
ncbi:MAG TPA: DUF1836 domain-containing protein [Clostridiaceae bacterium]